MGMHELVDTGEGLRLREREERYAQGVKAYVKEKMEEALVKRTERRVRSEEVAWFAT